MKKEKQIILDELSKMPPIVIETAYLYAKNFVYGVDVTEKWVTAVQNVSALEKAYRKGYYDALQRQAEIEKLLDKTFDDFCNCTGGEGWLKIDGKEYSTDVGYAIEGINIFMEVFKQRLAESEDEE